ncbi:MAG TPA: hypothetical protein VNL18_13170 [Gemmatimonadales bacterium]|nr:hypothetical protein [Gemmatimonadales bacterium]
MKLFSKPAAADPLAGSDVPVEATPGVLPPSEIDRWIQAESARAARYGRPYAVVVLRPELLPGEALDASVAAQAAAAVRARARDADIVGWRGDGVLAVLMPETLEHAARAAARRLQNDVWMRTRALTSAKFRAEVETFAAPGPADA